MDYVALKSEITTDPASLGYAALVTAGNDAGIANVLNAISGTVRVSKFITKTAIYRAVGFAAGLHLVGTLKAQAASSDPATALQFSEILDLLRIDGGGLDIGLDESRAVIDQLSAAGVMTPTIAAQIKAIGERPGSRAEVLWGAGMVVTVSDVSFALRGVR